MLNSNNPDETPAAFLLGRAAALLNNEYTNKEFQIRSLEKRIDMSPDFKAFLIEKFNNELDDIRKFLCQVDNTIGIKICNRETQSIFDLVMGNEKVYQNLKKLADKLAAEEYNQNFEAVSNEKQ